MCINLLFFVYIFFTYFLDETFFDKKLAERITSWLDSLKELFLFNLIFFCMV